jgi:hypothetical protein
MSAPVLFGMHKYGFHLNIDEYPSELGSSHRHGRCRMSCSHQSTKIDKQTEIAHKKFSRQFFDIFKYCLEITKIARATKDCVVANLFQATDITIPRKRSI